MNRSLKVFLLLMIVLFQVQANAANIAWRSYSTKIFAAAKQENKPILIYGKAGWCPYCRQMNVTFSNPQIADLVTKNFIPVMIDVDASPKLATNYNIMTLPTIVILDANNSVKETIIGYYDPSDFAGKLQSFLHH